MEFVSFGSGSGRIPEQHLLGMSLKRDKCECIPDLAPACVRMGHLFHAFLFV